MDAEQWVSWTRVKYVCVCVLLFFKIIIIYDPISSLYPSSFRRKKLSSSTSHAHVAHTKPISPLLSGSFQSSPSSFRTVMIPRNTKIIVPRLSKSIHIRSSLYLELSPMGLALSRAFRPHSLTRLLQPRCWSVRTNQTEGSLQQPQPEPWHSSSH